MPSFITTRRYVGALVMLAVLPLGCSSDDDGGSTEGQPPVATTPSAADQACANIISLIGYAEQVLLPAGQENDQSFDLNVRGRIAESVGTAERDADALPESLRAKALELAAAGKGLTNAQTPHDQQVSALLEWRRVADEIKSDCAEFTGGD